MYRYQAQNRICLISRFGDAHLQGCGERGNLFSGLPVDVGRAARVPRNQRHCLLCSSDALCDEHHIIFECPALSDLRVSYRQLFTLATATMSDFMWQKDTLLVAKFVSDALGMALAASWCRFVYLAQGILRFWFCFLSSHQPVVWLEGANPSICLSGPGTEAQCWHSIQHTLLRCLTYLAIWYWNTSVLCGATQKWR